MAKRKKAVKRKSGRRRRVGGIGGGDGIKMILGAAAGVVGGAILASKLPATLDNKIKGAIAAAGGFFLSRQSNPLIKFLGVGLAASGVLVVAKEVLPAGTIGFTGDWDRISGAFQDYPNNPQLNAIAGFNSFPNNPQRNVIAGAPASQTALGIS